MNFIGIDPGQSGGIALLTETSALLFKMPETEADTLEVLRACCEHRPIRAYVEKVHSMPHQGVASTWKFAMNYGMLRAYLLALGIPFESIPPSVWQRALGCLTKGDKNITKKRAQEFYPQLHITHATADALLICEYGRRQEREKSAGAMA